MLLVEPYRAVRRVDPKRQIAGNVATLRDLDEYFGRSVRVAGRKATALSTPGEYLAVLLRDGPDGHRRPCPVGAKTARLNDDTIAVAPGAQGHGYGALLLARAEDDARELGLSEVRLVTNQAMTENQTFYPRHGYIETARGRQDGYDRVFYAKKVAAH